MGVLKMEGQGGWAGWRRVGGCYMPGSARTARAYESDLLDQCNASIPRDYKVKIRTI